ncbi:MAG: radical SAM protein [Thermosynechococcaceae cyanobacterium]
MIFKLICVRPESPDDIEKFYYDNENGLLHDKEGIAIGKPRSDLLNYVPSFKTDTSNNPIRKHNNPRILKIQLGLSCNYSCSYCLQKYVPKADEMSLKTVSSFVDKVKMYLQGQPQNIQLWGGEPLVYIKTLKPLVSELKKIFPRARFTMITNGSLLNIEINDWIMKNEIGISISHDGPGQKFRGLDPFENPEKAEAILDLYRRKKAVDDPISIGAMIHAHNPDRAAVVEWFQEKFCDSDINIGEGAVIEVYDELAKQNSPSNYETHLMLRQTSFRNIRYQADSNFGISKIRISEWLSTMQTGRMLDSLGMRCGMDAADTLTVDLMGNVITCQNTSTMSEAPNGEPHKSGNIDNIKDIEIKTSVHFMNRVHCRGCPVVQTCKGGCMFLTGELFNASCDNTFTDHIPYFVAAVEILTGYVPIYIEDEAGNLPEERKDIFGYGKPKGVKDLVSKSVDG